MARSLFAVALSVAVLCYCPQIKAQQDSPLKDAKDGLTVNEAEAMTGYALVAPMNSKSTYLIDNESRVVNEWKSDYTPALSAYLLPNGHLLRPGTEGGFMSGGPGGGGRIQEFDWDGNLVWDFNFKEAFPDSKLRPHHDICPLPNGNVLVVCSDPKTKEESIAAGRLPPLATGQLQADAIIEIKPIGKNGSEIVWEWYAWNHLIQEVHKEKPNYGNVSEHPELIDINFANGMMDRIMKDPKQLAKLRSLGYVGGGTAAAPPRNATESSDGENDRTRRPGTDGPGRGKPGGPGRGGDWMHVNSVAYNAKLDQIMISVHEFSEVWIIDHSTTTQEAASHSGGKSGSGGDLLYRWGNPKVYRSGTNTDQRLFAQHCAHWIEDGLPGAGNMLVFNNGGNRPDGRYSSADEVELSLRDDGTYEKEEYVAFEPFQAKWRYGSPDNSEFFSMLISGCQRLPNGNTFICSGTQGLLFEVTPKGKVVWLYKHPGAGFGGPGGPSGSMFSGLVPGFLAGMLSIDDKQQTKIKELQDEVDAKLKDLLSEEQLAKLNAVAGFPRPPRGGGFPSPPKVGEVVSEAKRNELELTEKQSTMLVSIQKDVTTRLDEILKDEQRKQISDMENMFARGGPGRRGRGGPGGPGPGGPGGIFRVYKYAADYAGLKDRDLSPGEKLNEINGQSVE